MDEVLGDASDVALRSALEVGIDGRWSTLILRPHQVRMLAWGGVDLRDPLGSAAATADRSTAAATVPSVVEAWFERAALARWALDHHRGVLFDVAIWLATQPVVSGGPSTLPRTGPWRPLVGRLLADLLAIETSTVQHWARSAVAAQVAALADDVAAALDAVQHPQPGDPSAAGKVDGAGLTANRAGGDEGRGVIADDGDAGEPVDRFAGLGCLLYAHHGHRVLMSAQQAQAYLDAGLSTDEVLAWQASPAAARPDKQVLAALAALLR